MGDARFDPVYHRIRDAPDRAEELRRMDDEEVVAALAGAAKGHDPYLANVLASEVANRMVRARSIIASLGEGVLSVDRAGKLRSLNAAASRLGGWTGDVIGTPLHALVHDVEDEEGPCALARDLREGRSRATAGEFLRRDGSSLPVEYTISPLEREGERLGAVVVFRDVTEQLRAKAVEEEQAMVLEATARNAVRDLRARLAMEDALIASEARLAEAQRIGLTGSWEWDVAADEVTWSDGLWRIFDRPKDAGPLTYESYLAALQEGDRPRIGAVLEEAMRTGEPFRFEHRVVRRDGEVRHILGRGVVTKRDGKVVRVAGTATDVTDARRVADALTRQMERLAATNARLAEFTRVVSHDLRSPLALVLGYLDLVLDHARPSLAEREIRRLEEAHAAAENIQRLLDDLVEETRRVPAERGELEDAPLEAALASAMANLGKLIHDSAAKIDVAPGLPRVRARPHHLLQLFQNLIENAIKFAGDRPPRVHVSATTQGEFVVVHVVDEGPGVPPELRERIFDLYAHDPASPGGTGVGLAVCKRIVEGIGGTIWVDDAPGGGAAFHITLPKV